MANEQYLEEFVSPAGFKQLKELQAAVAENNKQLQEGIIIAKQYTDQIGASKGLNELNKNTVQAERAQQLLQNTIKRGQVLDAQVAAQRQKNADAESKRQAKALQDEAKAQAARERRRRTIISDSAAEVAAYNASREGAAGLTTTVNQLNVAEAQQAARATALVASNEAVAASATQAAVATQAQAAASVSAGNGLGSTLATGAKKAWGALRQIAYILPGVGIAGLLGFLTDPIIQYISSLDLFKKKLNELLQIRKQVSDANLKGAQDAQKELVQLKVLYSVAQNVTLSTEQRYEASKKLQEQYPKTFANFTIEQIQLGKVGAGYDKLTQSILATARARASEDKIAENTSRQLEDEQKIVDALLEIDRQRVIQQKSLKALRDPEQAASARFNADAAARAEARIAEQSKIVREAKKDSLILDGRNLALLKNINVQLEKGADLADVKSPTGPKIKEAPENFGTTLQDIIKQSEAIFKNDQNSFEKRLGALDSFIQNSQLLAEGDEGKLNLIKLNGEKERTKIIKQANDEQLKLITESEKARVQELLASNNDQFEQLESIREKDTAALEARYNEGKISKEDYEKSLFDIESSYAKDRVAIQIDTLEKVVEIQRSDLALNIGTNEELKKSERELSALRIQLAQLQRKEVKQTSEERIKAAEKELAAIKQLTEKSLEFGKALIDGIYTRRLNALSDESAALDKKKQQDIENVNDSVLTEQQKADQIAIINARAEAQQANIDERIRQQKIKQAKADKAQAIAQIIIQTALAQIKAVGTLGPFGFTFSPLITALGALSLATVIATPIPKFAVGTENSPEGFAWVGERGTEGRINPDGTAELTPNKPTLTYLEKGTKIIPNHKLVSIMAKPDKSNFTGAEQVPWGQIINEQRQTTKVLKKAFGDQSVNSTQVTRAGWKSTQTKMSKLQQHIKRNLS